MGSGDEHEAKLPWTILLVGGRGFGAMSPSEQRTIARMSWLYGQWLQQEAKAYGLPVLLSRPWDSLIERALAATEK